MTSISVPVLVEHWQKFSFDNTLWEWALKNGVESIINAIVSNLVVDKSWESNKERSLLSVLLLLAEQEVVSGLVERFDLLASLNATHDWHVKVKDDELITRGVFWVAVGSDYFKSFMAIDCLLTSNVVIS